MSFVNPAINTPSKKPPTCAHQATPPVFKAPMELMPLKKFIKNHRPMNTAAGMRAVKNMMSRGIKVRILARGKKTMYAPKTPEIAPLAPSEGT